VYHAKDVAGRSPVIAPRLGRGGRHASRRDHPEQRIMIVYILYSERSSRY